jgi:hypothetical protein
MDNFLPFLPFFPIVLLALLCPLMMVGIPVAAWVVARARGEKKPLSMGCMSGQCEHEEHAQQDAGLKEEVTRLQQEVQLLRAQLGPSGNGAFSSDHPVQVAPEEPRPVEMTGRTGEEEQG